MSLLELGNKEPDEAISRSSAHGIWSMEDALRFMAPCQIDNWKAIDVVLSPNAEGLLEDFPATTDTTLIVSGYAKSILGNLLGSSLQFLPLSPCDRDRHVLDVEYYLVIVLSKIDCLDYQRSMYKLDDHWLVSPVVIDPSRVPAGPVLFRPQGAHSVVVVDDILRDHLLEANITGARFYELLESNSEHAPEPISVPETAIEQIRTQWQRIPRYDPCG